MSVALTGPHGSDTFRDGNEPMRRRPTGSRLLALLLVPLLMIVGVGRAQAFYVCADRIARTTCCCPAAAQPADEVVDGVARIDAVCCALDERGAPAPVSRSAERDGGPSVAAVAIVVTAAPVAVQPARATVAAPSWLSPPRTSARSSQHVVLLL